MLSVLRRYLFLVPVFLFLVAVISCSDPKEELSPSPATGLAVSMNAPAGDDPELEAAVKAMGLFYLSSKPPATEFVLDKLGGGKFKLSDLNGKVVILNFWATWCAPCLVEMPSMQTLYNANKNKNLAIIAVDQMEKPEVVDKFIKQFKYTFPVVLDDQATASMKYEIRAFPTSYVIDRSGHIVAGWAGAVDWSSPAAQNAIDLLLSRS